MKKRKAMSLAEVLITLVVIGVLMMVLIPVITKTTANKERFLYKKAVNTLQNAVSAVMNENGVANSTNFWPEMGSLRKEIGSKIITLDGVHSGNDSTATDPDFRSSDGMIWYGIPETWPEGAKYVDVQVDVNGEGGTNLSSEDAGDYGQPGAKRPDRLRIRLMKDGRVVVPAYADSNMGFEADGDYDWSFESEYLTSQKSQAN